jgi:hypothetical protein
VDAPVEADGTDEAPVANDAADPDVDETPDHDADNMAVEEEIGVVAPE